jgi:hypothetical protein
LKKTLVVAVGLLLYSVLPAQATMIRGTFTGVVTSTFINYSSELDLPLGTPYSAIFGYDSDYLSAPDAFGYRQVLYAPPERGEYSTGFFFAIGPVSVGFQNFPDGGLGNPLGYYAIDAAGLPAAGGGAGFFDLQFDRSGFTISDIDRSSLTVQGTYSLPDYESTLPLTVMGLAALALVRRLL